MAAKFGSSDPKLKLKLLIDKKNMKVIFTEADKEFIDSLFSLMAFPLGTVVKLLKNNPMAGSVVDLFHSIESLDDTLIQSSENIKSILDLKPAPIAFKSPFLLSNCESVNRKAYTCLKPNTKRSRYVSTSTVFHHYTSDVPNTACPDCEKPMNCELKFVDSNDSANQGAAGGGGGGFVKGLVTYMVMDNLEVKPLSPISSIALINSLNIRDLSCLEEMFVHVGALEALKLLGASLESKNVLTSVFLDKEVNPQREYALSSGLEIPDKKSMWGGMEKILVPWWGQGKAHDDCRWIFIYIVDFVVFIFIIFVLFW